MNNVVFDRDTNQVIAMNREVRLYEYEVKLPYPINLTKIISEKTGIQIQKTDSDGNLLYKSNVIIDDFGNEIYEETIESYIYNQDNEGEEPELVQLEPVMIDEFVDRNYNFADNCTVFTYEEVLGGKIESINNNSLCSLVMYDEDFLESNLILNECHIGDGFVSIKQNGYIEINVTIPKIANIIDIYQESQSGLIITVNDISVTNNRVQLITPTNEISIKVLNPKNKNLELYALGVLS